MLSSFASSLRRQCVSNVRSFSSTARAMDVARASLLGRVGADIEVRESQNGKMYIRYPLAVSTGKDHTSWFNVLVFNENQVNFMSQYVKKG